jgi:hypothetical protein
MIGRIGKPTASNAPAIKVEQIARVGSLLPSANIRRRHDVGTGGVGSRYNPPN